MPSPKERSKKTVEDFFKLYFSISLLFSVLYNLRETKTKLQLVSHITDGEDRFLAPANTQTPCFHQEELSALPASCPDALLFQVLYVIDAGNFEPRLLSPPVPFSSKLKVGF